MESSTYTNQPPPPKRSGNRTLFIILGVLGGGAVLGCLGCLGVVTWMMRPPTASESAKVLFNLSSVPLPPLPERGDPMNIEQGVRMYEIQLGSATGPPGHGRLVWLYLPDDADASQPVPCVVIAPAGSNMISGMGLAEGDMPEHLPYVREGFAAISFEVDGFTDPSITVRDESAEIVSNYKKFRAAHAGLVNARNAVEYVLAQVPEVDPKRIYAAGHSSAATIALLLTEHDQRISACAAYAPVHDVVHDLGGVQVRMLSNRLPGLADFLVQSSPMTHYAAVDVPLFLFHAEDDSAVDVAQTREASRRLVDLGKDVTTVIVPSGDHYDSMIEEGMPQGIEWLKKQAGL